MSSAAWAPCCWLAARRSLSAAGELARGPNHQHHDHQEHEAADSDVAKDGRDQGKVVTEQIAGRPDDDGPTKGPERVEHLEPHERHACHSGEHRPPGAEPENEARGQHGLVPMPREQQLGSGDVIRTNPEDAPEAFYKRPPAPIAEVEAKVAAGDSAYKAEQDDEDQAVVPCRGPGGGREQEGFAGKRDAGALDKDAKPCRRITERVDDGGWVQPPSSSALGGEVGSDRVAVVGGRGLLSLHKRP